MILDMHILHIWTIKEHELRKYRKVLTIFKGSRCHVEIAFLRKLSTTQNNDQMFTPDRLISEKYILNYTDKLLKDDTKSM